MKYASIKYFDIANGPGTRVSLFVSGCTHHCKGCFNEIAWDFNYGNDFTTDVEDSIISKLKNPLYNGLSLLGGEPMEPQNQIALLPFIERVRNECPEKDIWCYSGYTWEELTGTMSAQVTSRLLDMIDILVDGPFILQKKDISLTFRGSSNQRILDVKESLKYKKPIFWKPDKDITMTGHIR